MMAADPIHVGVVYLETDYLETDQDVGSDSQGDRFLLSFTGGAPETELRELRIRTDKDGDGISIGDPIYDTASGGRGKNGFHDFRIVGTHSPDGRQIEAAAEVADGGQELVLHLKNFQAGDRIEFTMDVDEVLRNAADLATFNDRLDVITSGQEFQDSILAATFQSPHYQDASAEARFVNDYGTPSQTHGLDLPPDEGDPIDSRPNRSAAAVASTVQIPKPVSISGHVWLDNDLDRSRQADEPGLADVELALLRYDSASDRFVDTGHRAATDADGRYEFDESLGLAPGRYQVVQTQPDGLLSVAAVPGRVAGAETGRAAGADVLTDIAIPLGGQSAVDYDFAEAQPADLSGHVYRDDNNNGRRDPREAGLGGIRVRLVPVETLGSQPPIVVTTTADGAYSFSGIAPGTYHVVELDQPAGLDDGRDAAGTVAGRRVGAADDPGDRIRGIVLRGDNSGIEFDFGELPLGSLAGFVYLPPSGKDCHDLQNPSERNPLAGVVVELQNADGATVHRTTTGADGSYRFDHLSHGTYRIREFTPDGLIDGEAHVGRLGGVRIGEARGGGLVQNIVLAAGSHGTEYNFCEAAPATLSGYVYHDASDDGRRDTGETGLADVRLALVDADGREVATTRSGADGYYEFAGLEPGEYTIRQTQPNGYLDGRDTLGRIGGRQSGRIGSDGDSFVEVDLKQGQRGVEFNFGERLPASLSGRVHVDSNDNHRYDSGEPLLAGVTVRLIDSTGREVDRTTTDASGRYTLEDIVPGDYSVVEETPGGFFEGGARAGSAGGVTDGPNRIGQIKLGSGETAVDYDFHERPAATIEGLAFADHNDNGRLDSEEAPLENVLVELYDDNGTRLATARTGADGTYRFTHLRAGHYTVREIQPAGWLQGGQSAGSHGGDASVTDTISQVPVGWGDRLTQYNFFEVAPSTLSGQVYVDRDGDCRLDAGEPPVAGARIDLLDHDGNLVASTKTDASGQYRFEGVAPGRYEIREHQPEGYFQGCQTLGSGGGKILGDDRMAVTLHSGVDLVDYHFAERQPSSISGRVWSDTDGDRHHDAGETPLAETRIDLRDAGGNRIASTKTDAAGRYRFTGLRPGVYSVHEHQPDGFFQGGQVVGSAGGRVGGDDSLVAIGLSGGIDAAGYDFPEVPPGTISGYVFQDGDALALGQPPAPEDLRRFRDGQRTADDQPLAGVTLELRAEDGTPIGADHALGGRYPSGPIRVRTNAAGYYEFTGLPPGTYHVYQVQPDELHDGLDTAGTTGGIALNPADAIESAADRESVRQLRSRDQTDPGHDAILNIALGAGDTSAGNNFSEIAVTPVPPSGVDAQASASRGVAPIETFDHAAPIVGLATYRTLRHPIVAVDEWAVSWHLSVINGGFPRGATGATLTVESVSGKHITDWNEQELNRGRWTVAPQSGETTGLADAVTLGAEDAIALSGDFNGNGSDQAALFVGGQWFIDLNDNGRWDAGDLWVRLGTEMDRPVIGDWDGDGKDDVGIFGRQWHRDPERIKYDPGLPDPANERRRQMDRNTAAAEADPSDPDIHRWLRRGRDGTLRADAVDHVFQYGEQVDTPVAGDWNGDGIDQIAVYRSGQWLLDTDGDGRWTSDQDAKAKFGQPADTPVVGDFNGDGIDEVGVVRGDTWIIDTDGDRRLTGNDLRIVLPPSGPDSQPVVGDFNGDGKDEPGYYDEAG